MQKVAEQPKIAGENGDVSAGRWPPETPEQTDEILGRKTAKTAGAMQS